MATTDPGGTQHHGDSASHADEPMGSGERSIRQLAAAAGYRTLRSVARDAEVDRMTLRLAARGERTPTPAIVERIARVLHVGPEVLDRVFAAARAERATP